MTIPKLTIPQLYELYRQHPSIQTDTRQLQPGDLFFALKGPSYNGNQFAGQALQQGAAYAIIDELPTATPSPTSAGSAAARPGLTSAVAPASPGSPGISDRLILVPDVLTTLQDLALHHRRQFHIPFIAITGSNGKTTTKELIHAVLSAQYITYTTRGNLNNHIGIPLTLLSIRPDAQFAVIEMGANHQKEIEGYCKYTLPTHGIITNIGKAHLEGFGGPEGVRKGKGELYDFLRGDQVPALSSSTSFPSTGGTAFVLQDSADLREMSRGIPHIIKYGTPNSFDANVTDITGANATDADANVTDATNANDADANVTDITGGIHRPATAPAANGAASTLLHVDITGGAAIGIIHTQLVGDYNLPNVLVAVAVGKHFSVPDEKIRTAIEQYTPSNSRSQLIERDGNHIILDAYNANPSSMRAAIENFAALPTTAPGHGHSSRFNGGKILILGAMAELGTESLAEHHAIIDLIRKYHWEEVVLVGGDFQKIPHGYLGFANSNEAGEWLRHADIKDAYLLIKGSRSMKMEDVLPS